MIRIFLIFLLGILPAFAFSNYTSGTEIGSVIINESLTNESNCNYSSDSIQFSFSNMPESITQLSYMNNYILDSNQRGCCSHHGGVCGCEGGRKVCCDGTFSPSCTC